MLMDRCPLASGQEVVTRHLHLPVLIAFWVMYPLPLYSMYIHRQEYATNQDDTESTTASDMQATLSWAVKFRTAPHRKTAHRTDYDENAHRIAKEVDLLNDGQVGELLNHYLFVHTSYNASLNGTDDQELRRIQEATENKLRRHPDVEWFHQQQIRRRTKRSLHFTDPSYPMQWHLHNHKTPGMDINVTEVWNHNITGTGVVVAVIDDGLEWRNEDILANYNAKGSWDLNNNDPDPMPEVHKDDGKSLNRHGTRCAGEIAAVANDKCAVGVAFNAQISGIRLLDGPMTDSLEATAFNKNMHINDIYSCSWGPDDDGKTVDGPHPLAQAALKHGVTAGRRGLGSIFVVASGNGGRNEDNCNYDGYANSMYTVTIGAVDESGQMPYYAEQCASMLAVTFSSGATNRRNIVTTDWTLAKGTGCTTSHTGTSAAAPLAAGMIGLMLQAKPCLTWRDIQHIIIYTAVKIDEKNAVWITNAGGFHHSHKHGFGLMSAWRLVNAAKAWHTVPWLTSIEGITMTENEPILAGKTLTVAQTVSNASAERNELRSLEHVLVTVSLTHSKRGMLEVHLLCPSGTESVIGARRKKDESPEGLKSWTFSTVRCWGENPVGEWKLVISDNHPGKFSNKDVQKGKLQSWKLTLYGSNMNRQEIEKRKVLVSEAMSGIFLDANLSEPCSYYWNVSYGEESLLSSRVMEVLLYLSGIFTLMAIYYTLEQAFCNYEDKAKDKQEGSDSEDLESGHDRRHPGGDGEERTHLLEEFQLETLGGDQVSKNSGRHTGHSRHLTEAQAAGGSEIPKGRANTESKLEGQAHLVGNVLITDQRHTGTVRHEQKLQGDKDARRGSDTTRLNHREESVGSDHGTPRACQKEQTGGLPNVTCSCEISSEVHRRLSLSGNPAVTWNPGKEFESVHTHCPQCQKSQVQYSDVPSQDHQSSSRDLSAKTNVPVVEEVPSQHAFSFTKHRDAQSQPLQSPPVGFDCERLSSMTSTAGQFAERGRLNSATGHLLGRVDRVDSVCASPETLIPPPGGVPLSAMTGLNQSGSKRHWSDLSVCSISADHSYHSGKHEPTQKSPTGGERHLTRAQDQRPFLQPPFFQD
ncbi:proprotein convertase subtilisin/kexin type 7-like isoform X2 [Acanthaster planci]|uniref:Proprotein convertase subtilisin/kexin type 7-like isoform X2 n=1 Tax=Acanthaster planci TaxID=133434 RepID=A0A8B7YNJ5_ACAPL|nr:proprotein convertase subtilisin/kexin type 7-like isoform X2 [Acanthaster planci]